MSSESDIQNSIIQLQEAFGTTCCSNPGLKWELLKKLSPHFLHKGCNYDCEFSDGYCTILTSLLGALSPTLLSNEQETQLFTEFFISGIHHYSFIILVEHLTSSKPSFQQVKILELLEKFIQAGNIYSMFICQCCSSDLQSLKAITNSSYWDNLITLLVSLPERVANKTNQRVKKIFCHSFYIPIVVSSVWKVLCTVHKNLNSQKDCSIEFLGKLTGRLCFSGHSIVVAKNLGLQLVKVCASDFVWRRIAQNFILKIPLTNIEMFLVHTLQEIPWYVHVDWLLGDAVLTNKKIQYLMTVKFLLLHQFKHDLMLQNIIGYLAYSDKRASMFRKVFITLLDVWADESAFRHQSSQQQYYVASAIMCCIAHLKAMDYDPNNQALMQKALQGVQIRLGNPVVLVRSTAMIVGENLVTILDPTAPKLEFEHDVEQTEVKHLLELLNIPQEPEEAICDSDMLLLEDLCLSDELQAKQVDIQSSDYSPASKPVVDDLDSDDDLDPYDMSNDLPNEGKNKPFYIRDCLQGLIEAEKPEWTEQCLRSATNLISANPEDTSEVAVELAKVLLHLDDSFGMPDFLPCRHRALMAITVQCPLQVAKYLTSQFYERDYNIRQRLDILEVVAAASQALSQPRFKLASMPTEPVLSEKAVEENWQQVIEKRLESKTRRFSLAPRRQLPEPQLNAFGPVAGHFFFPLLEKYDSKTKMLNLMGDDSYVLGRLLYTLGIVMHSSCNTSSCRRMGSSLLKFIDAVHNHCEAFVRKGAIFAASMVFVSVPAFLLISELQDDVVKCQIWLNDVIDKDCDVDCQVKAAQAAQMLMKSVENELPSINSLFHQKE